MRSAMRSIAASTRSRMPRAVRDQGEGGVVMAVSGCAGQEVALPVAGAASALAAAGGATLR